MRYLRVNLLLFATAILDYSIKGMEGWDSLPPFYQGWSWHLFMFLIFIFVLILLALGSKDFSYLLGIIIYPNEDLYYYLLKSIFNKEIYYNTWIGINLWVILIGTLILNLTFIFIIKRVRN